ncbi:MAG: hypothetical protein HIU92_20740 [Proteobacteria bacterium]|nr:hypothetical protein [Pseudomonadota bacterium]
MNHIHALTTRATAAEAAVAAKDEEIQRFRIHLSGPKFQGTDLDGGRKDWIAVADVLAWLALIKSAGE